MSRTPFSSENAAFSDTGHKLAQRLIYPVHFKARPVELKFETTKVGNTTRDNILDGELAIDRIVTVTRVGLRAPIRYTVQERFREAKWAAKQDLTVTEWNHDSDLPSELYKINAVLFVYGYVNVARDGFVDWICADLGRLLRGITEETIPYQSQYNPRSHQTFRCYLFTDMDAAGCIVSRMPGGRQLAAARPLGNTMRSPGNTFASVAVDKLVAEGHDVNAVDAALYAMKTAGLELDNGLLTPDEVDKLRAAIGAVPLIDYQAPEYPPAWTPQRDQGHWKERWGSTLFDVPPEPQP